MTLSEYYVFIVKFHPLGLVVELIYISLLIAVNLGITYY